ncbi:hypothetical protein TKK_0015531 [Trichogramma kaykai]
MSSPSRNNGELKDGQSSTSIKETEDKTDEVPNKPQLVMERIDEKLSQLTSAYNKMANHINCMDTNCENMWLKIKTIEQTMEFMMEQLECVTKHVSDINVNMKLRNEEEREQVHNSKLPPTNRNVPIEQLLSSTIAPANYNNRHTLNDSLENIETASVELSLSKRSKLDATINEIKNKTRVKRNYCLNNKIIFSDWLEFLKAELEYSDLLQYIESEDILRESPEERSKINAIIKDVIISRVDKSFQTKILSMKEPIEILRKLKETRLVQSNVNTFDLKCDIFHIKMKSNEKVSDFCDRFDGMVKLYDESEPPAPLTEHDKASAFFRATQERCDELRKSNWMQKAMSNVDMTVDEMKCYLLQAEANKNRD